MCAKFRACLACVHLKDFKPGSLPDKAGNASLGAGTVDFAAVIQALDNTGFKGYVMAEGGGSDPEMRDYMLKRLGLEI